MWTSDVYRDITEIITQLLVPILECTYHSSNKLFHWSNILDLTNRKVCFNWSWLQGNGTPNIRSRWDNNPKRNRQGNKEYLEVGMAWERGVWRACQSSHSEARREGKGFLYTVGKIYPMLHKDGRLWNNTSNWKSTMIMHNYERLITAFQVCNPLRQHFIDNGLCMVHVL